MTRGGRPEVDIEGAVTETVVLSLDGPWLRISANMKFFAPTSYPSRKMQPHFTAELIDITPDNPSPIDSTGSTWRNQYWTQVWGGWDKRTFKVRNGDERGRSLFDRLYLQRGHTYYVRLSWDYMLTGGAYNPSDKRGRWRHKQATTSISCLKTRTKCTYVLPRTG